MTPILTACESGFTPLCDTWPPRARSSTPRRLLRRYAPPRSGGEGLRRPRGFPSLRGRSSQREGLEGWNSPRIRRESRKRLNREGNQGQGRKGWRQGRGCTALLSKKLEAGEAIVWYTGHSGWAVQTTDNFLVFDYFQDRPRCRCPFHHERLHLHCRARREESHRIRVAYGPPGPLQSLIFEWAQQMPGITTSSGKRRTPRSRPR